MHEADPSDTPVHVTAKETTDSHTVARFWSLPEALGWISWRNVDTLSRFTRKGWVLVRRELLYDHSTSRPGAVMLIGTAWRELHDALETGRIAAFDAAGAQLPPAYWGRRHNLAAVTGNDAMLRSAEVQELWPTHVGEEEWLRRSTSRGEIYARHDACMRAANPADTESTEPVSLPSVRWPPPLAKAYLTACEVVTWLGWGEARPKERAADLEADLFEVWGVSGNLFGRLIRAFETGERQEGLEGTPERVRERINQREGASYDCAQLAERLKSDCAILTHAYELLNVASDAVVKACVDQEVEAIGRRGNEQDRVIPHEVFAQLGVVIEWWDVVHADRIGSWDDVRFRHSDILRLWPAQQSEPAETKELQQAEPTPRLDVARIDVAPLVALVAELPSAIGGAVAQAMALRVPETEMRAPVDTAVPDAAELPAAAPKPVSKAELTEWYSKRVQNWPADKPSPSEAEDVEAAKDAFRDHIVSRDQVRVRRRSGAPDAWKAAGRKSRATK